MSKPPSLSNRVLFFVFLAGGAVTAFGFIQRKPTHTLNAPTIERQSNAAPSETPAKSIETTNISENDVSIELPYSLRNAGAPAPLDIDDQGNLIVNIKVRNFFDFYLSALGEETLEALTARIAGDLSTLPQQAQDRALAILNGYIGYRQAVDAFLERSAANNFSVGRRSTERAQKIAAAEQKLKLRELRRDFFDDETIDAFFGAEDQYDDYVLARLRIEENEFVSDAQKAAEKQKLLETMPDWFQEQERVRTAVAAVRALEFEDLTPNEKARRQAALVGPEAAARLQLLDQRRAVFKSRVDAYEKAVEDLEAVYGSPGSPAYEKALNALREQSFSKPELIRLRGQRELEQERARLNEK